MLSGRLEFCCIKMIEKTSFISALLCVFFKGSFKVSFRGALRHLKNSSGVRCRCDFCL